MESERTPRFWELARAVAGEARRHGLVVPGFRSPPRLPGAVRTVRRTPGGEMVAVVWRGRSPAAVVADMIDGVVLVNGLVGPKAAACRQLLRAGLAPVGRAGGEVAPMVPGGQDAVAEVIPLVRRPAVAARAAATG